jgi:hypothetical protein
METKQIRAEAALQALVDLQAGLATRPYLMMAELGIITSDQAVCAIRETAIWAEREPTAEPFVGYAIGQALRNCAALLDDRKPKLQLVDGGRAD